MKKLLTLIAGVAVAGSASAALIASQDFDGGGTGISSWSYGANLSTVNGYAETTTPGTDAGNSVGTLNSPSTGNTFWLSYRFTMASHASWSGSAKNAVGFGSQWDGGIDRIGFYPDGTPGNYGKYYLGAGATGVTVGNEVLGSTIVLDPSQNEDLFVVGLFQYAGGNVSMYMSVADWADRATLTEANVLSGFSVTASTGRNGGLDELLFNIDQGDTSTATPTTLDNILVGTTYADIAAIPEPATLGMLSLSVLMALAVRRMRM